MLGDCTGIGPEQCARVLADRRLADAARLLVVGDARVLEQGARDAGVTLRVRRPARTPRGRRLVARDEIPIIDLANLDPARDPARRDVAPSRAGIAGETLAST